MQDLYQKMLDWSVWFEDADEEALRDGIVALFRTAPLYDDEFRMVAARLLAAAKHLVDDEQLQVWTHVVYRILEDFALNFRSAVLLPVGGHDEGVRPDATFLTLCSTWPVPTTAPRRGNSLLYIDASSLQRTGCSVTVADKHTALELWETTRWRALDEVVWNVMAVPAPEAFFGTRLRLPDSADEDMIGMLLLRAVAAFIGDGGSAAAGASEAFWNSHLSLPLNWGFQGCFTLIRLRIDL